MGSPFSGVGATPTNHFRLAFYAAVTGLVERAFPAFGSPEATLERFPFLKGYLAALPDSIRESIQARGSAAWWADALTDWERAASDHLPLLALRSTAGLDVEALVLLFTIGLVDEDARFGPLIEAMQEMPGRRRPLSGAMSGWWRGGNPDAARGRLRRLIALGLVQLTGHDGSPERTLSIPGPIREALRGEPPSTEAWATVLPADGAAATGDLILPDSIRSRLDRVPAMLRSGEVRAVLVRGPAGNGRRTLLRAIAREVGRGTIEFRMPPGPDDERCRLVGPLATLLHAMPIFPPDLGPGETVDLPPLSCFDGPIGVAIARHGGVRGPDLERAVTLAIPLPDPEARRRHWELGFGARAVDGLDEISDRFRMTVGHIRHAAALACARASLEGREVVVPADVRDACRALNRQALDSLATRIEARGGPDDLAIGEETRRELRNLEGRCRQRERLAGAVGPALGSRLNCGVRALFEGPSGTGKTLAAQLLASGLGMDLYRLDLASVVNKYIGETEKNLDQVFSRAEDLDVILLIDEGDALMTQRTNVSTANDRYANLETNYLLQRLESFEGIVIVTTNAGDRIDSAFLRRIDAVVSFHPPEAEERWSLWRMHLPESHRVDSGLLREIAARCQLSGGQIRNAALHAAMLALEDGQVILGPHVEDAVHREYRKQGAVCPLRRRT